MRHILTAIVLAATFVMPISAGPLKSATVDRNATWVLHLDCEAFVDSTIGGILLAEDGGNAEMLSALASIGDDVGIDVASEVKSLTIYGIGDNEDNVVAILHTSSAINKTIEKGLREEEFEAVQHDGTKLYVTKGGGIDAYFHVQDLGADRRLVIAAPNAESVIAGLGVINGSRPSLKGHESDLFSTRPSPGSFAFGGGANPGFAPGNGPESVIVQMSDRFSFDIGESEGEVFAAINLTTESVEDARELIDILEGGIALARAAMEGQPDLAEVASIIDGLRFKIDDDTIQARFRCDAETLAALLEQMN